VVNKGQVTVDLAARTVFVVFEDYDICVGIGEEGPDEVFADDALLQRGETKVVAFQIMDLDAFKPDDLDRYDYGLSDGQKAAVRQAYLRAINA
jgi:hypothetical protein